mgnify:CR=1 FL=1
MIYEYWLAGIKEITDLKKQKLREVYGSGKAIYYIEETKLDKLRFLNEKDVAILKNAKKDTELEEKWRRTEEKRKSAAIVGARNCTAYGEQMALQYGKSLAEAGIQIISGMARGIDGAGQRGALNSSWAKESGVTYAVLGCGVDVCYPRENIGLYMDIQEKGGIVSEFSPGTQPYAWNFPRRNRIISALADWILIMEAKERSGSLITADLALEQGKDVYALPGPVNSVLSQGCHRLIRQGAGILITPEELMDEWNINPVEIGQKGNKSEKMLESPEFMVYSCLDLFPKGTNQLMKETGLSVTELMERLITLELNGYVKEVSRNYYIRLQ